MSSWKKRSTWRTPTLWISWLLTIPLTSSATWDGTRFALFTVVVWVMNRSFFWDHRVDVKPVNWKPSLLLSFIITCLCFYPSSNYPLGLETEVKNKAVTQTINIKSTAIPQISLKTGNQWHNKGSTEMYSEASIPPTTMALFPPLSRLTLFLPPPSSQQTIFGHCIRNFVQFVRVFSEFWKLSVRENDPPPKKKTKKI